MTDTERVVTCVLKDIHQDVDGFYYYWPNDRGYWNAWPLLAIADHLDKLNAPWEAEIERYFRDNPPVPSGGLSGLDAEPSGQER